jgi:hypothetical protein
MLAAAAELSDACRNSDCFTAASRTTGKAAAPRRPRSRRATKGD